MFRGGPPLRVRGRTTDAACRDVAATRHFHTPLPDSWGKGGRKKNVDLDGALKVTFVFSIIPNLCWNSSLSRDFKLCEEEC